MDATVDSQRGLEARMNASREEIIKACVRASKFLGQDVRVTALSAKVNLKFLPGLVVSPTVSVNLTPGENGSIVVRTRVEEYLTLRNRIGMIPKATKRMVGDTLYFDYLNSLVDALQGINKVGGSVWMTDKSVEGDTAPNQFFPIRVVAAQAQGEQRLYPIVDRRGVPRWQAGDGNILRWDITSMGWAHGHPQTRSDYVRIKGQVMVTDARVVLVAHNFVRRDLCRCYDGSAELIPESGSESGAFLVAQMRLPWLSAIAFGTPSGAKTSRGEVRLATEQLAAFQHPEAVLLLLRLADPQAAASFTAEVIQRAKSDRYQWSTVSDEARASLDQTPDPHALVTEGTSLALVQLAGGRQVDAKSAPAGVNSSRSYPSPPSTVSDHTNG